MSTQLQLRQAVARVSGGRRAMALSDLARYNVNRLGDVEGVWNPLYDYQTYPTAGAAQLTYFQAPLGGATGRTYEDTNIDLGGQLSTPTEFLITSIGVNFLSNFPTDLLSGAINSSEPLDTFTVLKRGFMRVTIGSKDYIKYTNLMEFPAAGRMNGFGAASNRSVLAAGQRTAVGIAQSTGPQFAMTPIRLPSGQAFRATIEYPNGAVAATAGGRLGIILYGFMYRLSQ